MKNTPSFSLISLFTILLCLAACNGPTKAITTSDGTPQVNTQPGNTSLPLSANTQPGNTNLPLAAQLAVGTLRLEGTDQAVTTEQATQLLPLWQAYRTLSASDTAAQVELEAVIQQIQGTLTPEQTQAIELMQLTRQSMSEVLQALGLNLESEGTPGAQRTPPAGSMFPVDIGGDGPGNGNGFGRGQGRGESETGTTDEVDTGIPGNGLGQSIGNQNAPGSNAQSVKVSPALLEAVIKMLETKAQSQMIIIPNN